MKIEKAIELLQQYQQWSLGKIDDISTVLSHNELTEALDVVLQDAKYQIQKRKLNEILRRESEETKDLNIEEAAKKYAENKSSNFKNTHIRDFTAGAKWQEQRMFSEDDLREAYSMGMFAVTSGRNFNDWFKQYKKK